MIWTNYHSHTHYCDGKGKVADYIDSAVAQKMPSYGISSHNPLPGGEEWGMHLGDFEKYLYEVNDAKNHYKDQIEILAGLEIDYFPFLDKPDHWLDKLDYWVGSIHFIDKFNDGRDWEIDGSTKIFKDGLAEIFDSDIKKVVQRYYQLTLDMISQWDPPILGHLDKIKMHNKKESFFNEKDTWYLEEIEEVLDAAKANNTIIEINTRGLYKGVTEEPYPSYSIIEMIRDREIPIMLNSDSHRVREMYGEFEQVAAQLKKIGFQTLIYFNKGKLTETEFDEKGLKIS